MIKDFKKPSDLSSYKNMIVSLKKVIKEPSTEDGTFFYKTDHSFADDKKKKTILYVGAMTNKAFKDLISKNKSDGNFATGACKVVADEATGGLLLLLRVDSGKGTKNTNLALLQKDVLKSMTKKVAVKIVESFEATTTPIIKNKMATSSEETAEITVEKVSTDLKKNIVLFKKITTGEHNLLLVKKAMIAIKAWKKNYDTLSIDDKATIGKAEENYKKVSERLTKIIAVDKKVEADLGTVQKLHKQLIAKSSNFKALKPTIKNIATNMLKMAQYLNEKQLAASLTELQKELS